MKEIKTEFLIPSKTHIKRGESLNILIGIHNDNPDPTEYIFRIFGDVGCGFSEIFSQKKILEPGANPHHYFNIPGESLSDGCEGEEVEEIFIATDSDGNNGCVIFIE